MKVPHHRSELISVDRRCPMAAEVGAAAKFFLHISLKKNVSKAHILTGVLLNDDPAGGAQMIYAQAKLLGLQVS